MEQLPICIPIFLLGPPQLHLVRPEGDSNRFWKERKKEKKVRKAIAIINAGRVGQIDSIL